MSARDVIRQIEALPPEEQREVKEYFVRKEAEETPVVRRMDATEAAAVAERVFSEHAELFRKLAQ
jgi:hypothetical protein